MTELCRHNKILQTSVLLLQQQHENDPLKGVDILDLHPISDKI